MSSEEPSSDRIVTLSGLLYADGRVVLGPLFPTGQEPVATEAVADDDGVLAVDFLGDDGVTLQRVLVVTETLCEHGAPGTQDPPRAFVSSALVPGGTKVIRLSIRGRELQRIDVPDSAPRVEMTWRPPASRLDGVHVVSWRADHPADAPLTAAVRYAADDGPWVPVSLPEAAAFAVLDFDLLPGGTRCRIEVVISDGINTTSAESPAFGVARKGTQPLIVALEAGDTITADDVIVLRGQGIDIDERTATPDQLKWVSSRDGELGTGEVVETRLSPGLHQIVLQVDDDPARMTSMEVLAVPREAPRPPS